MKYFVEKRIINNYLVEVEADTPEAAIQAAFDNEHEPGVPVSDHEDGDTFYPSDWRVYLTDNEGEKELEVDSSKLTELD